MNVTWYGTAAVMIDDGKTKLLFDPFIRRNKRMVNPDISDFVGADAILVTHGHFDHIADIPKIVSHDGNVRIYCTKTPGDTLKKKNVSEDQIETIVPGDTFRIGDFNIRVHQGRHVDFDPEHIRKVFLGCVLNFPKFFYYAAINSKMPETDEIVAYEIENDGKRVLVMGSYGIDENVSYPKNVDMFIMPFGGSPKIKKMAIPFIDAVTPKSIFADHHDNAFPPLTRRMDVEGFEQMLAQSHPDTVCIIPDEYKAYVV